MLKVSLERAASCFTTRCVCSPHRILGRTRLERVWFPPSNTGDEPVYGVTLSCRERKEKKQQRSQHHIQGTTSITEPALKTLQQSCDAGEPC